MGNQWLTRNWNRSLHRQSWRERKRIALDFDVEGLEYLDDLLNVKQIGAFLVEDFITAWPSMLVGFALAAVISVNHSIVLSLKCDVDLVHLVRVDALVGQTNRFVDNSLVHLSLDCRHHSVFLRIRRTEGKERQSTLQRVQIRGRFQLLKEFADHLAGDRDFLRSSSRDHSSDSSRSPQTSSHRFGRSSRSTEGRGLQLLQSLLAFRSVSLASRRLRLLGHGRCFSLHSRQTDLSHCRQLDERGSGRDLQSGHL